jgi:hypothetical protein
VAILVVLDTTEGNVLKYSSDRRDLAPEAGKAFTDLLDLIMTHGSTRKWSIVCHSNQEKACVRTLLRLLPMYGPISFIVMPTILIHKRIQKPGPWHASSRPSSNPLRIYDRR